MISHFPSSFFLHPHFLPDWVKADRIIRKHLKEVSSPPLVPFSSFDPLPSIKSAQPASLSSISSSISQTIAISQSPSQTISSSPSPSLIHPLGSSDKPSHRLVEEIAEEPETPHERLEGGSGIPSLLLIVPQETNHRRHFPHISLRETRERYQEAVCTLSLLRSGHSDAVAPTGSACRHAPSPAAVARSRSAVASPSESATRKPSHNAHSPQMSASCFSPSRM